LGTLTGTKDFVSNLALGFQHHQNPVQVVKSAMSAWTNMRENIAESFEMGRNRVNVNSMEMGDGGDTDLIAGLRRFRDVLADVQGRNFLEQMTRATAYGQGKFLALDFLQQHKNGELSTAGKKFLKDFGKDINLDKPNETDIKRLASRYVDSVQGTYDYRGLPAIAVEGSLSPYLALARWNIEKSNNFLKHVVTPALNGNIQPLLMSSFGMLLGGAAINELTEAMTGRKNKTATVAELKAAKAQGANIKMDVLYKTIGIASAAGYAGQMMDLAKMTMDYMYGKNKPQVYNNVLIEAMDNNITTIGNFIAATAEEGFNPDLYYEAAIKLVEDNLQAARLILGSTVKKDDVERANKFRDLRTFNTLQGNPVSDLRNQYTENFDDLDVKKFKRAETIEEARTILPELLDEAIEDSKMEDGSIDVDKLKSQLRRIKQNSYQTMPNPKTIPRSFLKYIQHLEASQGKEVANKRLTDYLTQNAINRAKSSMVP
jgi:hypothetical protein